MNDAGSVLLPVRAEARQLVAPDYAVVGGLIEDTTGSKEEAVRSAAGLKLAPGLTWRKSYAWAPGSPGVPAAACRPPGSAAGAGCGPLAEAGAGGPHRLCVPGAGA